MAFHPGFAHNGRFFVYYTAELTGGEDVLTDEEEALGITSMDHKVVVSEMRVSAADRDEADADFEKVLLELRQPYANHNGGEVS